MKETTMGKTYVSVLGLAPNSATALALLNWRIPSYAGKV